MTRAIRGAICAENTTTSILANTKTLLGTILETNSLHLSQIISITFTCTKDLDAIYPAVAARDMGLVQTSLMCVAEMDVAGAMQGLIRVQVLAEMDMPQNDVRHIYLGEAEALRPDLIKDGAS
ncbi:MAG: chorismate mutase [Defluviitaleaceae bacterium]|nr:chorismate mutase [Defluviitaleaceae bacterium]